MSRIRPLSENDRLPDVGVRKSTIAVSWVFSVALVVGAAWETGFLNWAFRIVGGYR